MSRGLSTRIAHSIAANEAASKVGQKSLSFEQLEARCDVRDTVGFAANARTFPAFRKLRRTALHAIQAIASTQVAAQPVNSTFGWSSEQFNEQLPWFDKWLPARFESLHVLPSIMVQQIRQGEEKTSSAFMAKCMRPSTVS